MNVKQLGELELAEDPVVHGERFPQCQFVYYKSHRLWPGIKPEPQWWEVEINRLSCIRSDCSEILHYNYVLKYIC
jgi:hypothetical protein